MNGRDYFIKLLLYLKDLVFIFVFGFVFCIWVMNKQKLYKFRIRKLKRRVRKNVPLNLSNINQISCFSGDGNTELKDFSEDEEIDQNHQIDIEKQLEISVIRQEDKQNDLKQNKIGQIQKDPLSKNSSHEAIEVQLKKQQSKQQFSKDQVSPLQIDQVNPQSKHLTLEIQNNLQIIKENQIEKQPFVQNQEQLKQAETNIQKICQIQLKREQESKQQKIQFVSTFSSSLKRYVRSQQSQTILIDPSQTIATQINSYWQNKKLILTEPIVSKRAKAVFRINNLKYCVGTGLALKQIVQKHEFNYKSYENELSHGLFLITSQGYSWSHIYKSQDDVFRLGFNKVKNNDKITIQLESNQVSFSFQQNKFVLQIPQSIRQKYTLCFCAYLHEKTDSVSLEPVY